MNPFDKVEILTTFLPPISIDLNSSSTSPSPLLRLLKPRINVDGKVSFHTAPYGEPTQHWPAIKIALSLAAAFFVFLYLFSKFK